MDWLDTYWLRLIFLGGYMVMLVRHCLEGSKETENTKDYLTGGGKLGGWTIALSFYATFVSTNSFVGHAGKSWDVGLIWYVKGLVIVACCYLAWYVVAPRFFRRAREYDSLTVPDFLGTRYESSLLRRIAAVIIFGAAALYLVAVYKGSALALQQFLGLDYKVAAVAVFFVVTTYTLAGGFRSVVLTDAVQGLLMAVGAVVIFVAVLYKGGWARSDSGSGEDAGSGPCFVARENAFSLDLRAFSGRRNEAVGRPETDFANLWAGKRKGAGSSAYLVAPSNAGYICVPLAHRRFCPRIGPG